MDLFYCPATQLHKPNTHNQSTMLNSQVSAQPSPMDNDMASRISVSRPPAPPLLSFVSALGIVMLIMWVSAFSTFLSLPVVLVLYIIHVCLCWFVHERREVDIEMRQRFQNPENYQRVSEFVDRFLWVLEERGRQGQQEYSKELVGSVACFGSHGMPSGCIDCPICLDDFEKGEECLVFPVCRHAFHSNCIRVWLEWKMTCPICRRCILSPMTSVME